MSNLNNCSNDKNRPPYRAVIFDMDGTLFDTERVYRSCWLAAGVPLEVYLSFIGTQEGFVLQKLSENGLDAHAVMAERRRRTAEVLAQGIPVKPGVHRSLQFLAEQGILRAVATSTRLETACDYLDRSGLKDMFTEIVSGAGLKNGKPAPDIFLITADRLGVSPEECIVVEDSFNGVRAGKAAGMRTVMIPDLVEPDEEIRGLADIILPSMTELPGWLKG